MWRLSNKVIGLLNIVTLLISLFLLGYTLFDHFSKHHSTFSIPCLHLLQIPVLNLALFLFFLSLAGLFGSLCKMRFLLYVYAFLMFALILAVVIFTVFVFVITNKGAGRLVSGRGYKEYRLGDYSHWLQKRISAPKIWTKINGCLVEAHVCGALGHGDFVQQKADEFYRKNLSPIQSGCCKPPTACGYVYRNATFWDLPKSGTLNSTDHDCLLWSNNQTTLCYNCGSCQAGLIATVKHDWRMITAVNVALLLFLIIVYSLSCCALKNNRAGNYYRGQIIA
ncbi:tetraspanin-8-like [Amborella trichopoda]|uniref:tetraspanin-8-like n=1 Tax=Amborella trichopoda TaxID=13333 RepID=UPI0009BDADA3|nr:tetraspanin-8-like [Amborella trichopoda]|eukprot:XP_011623332.2 tetraspanin-8-like [Amborella trichopoda]